MRVLGLLGGTSAALGIGVLLSCSLWAQQPAGTAPGSHPEPSAAKPVSLQPPPAKSPVDLFRSLLAMGPIERRDFISKRPAAARKLILAKIQEYEGLQPEQRELRLRVTELRWYLLPLLRASAVDRAARLATIPEDLRGLVEARLQQWDQLSPEVQKQLLDNESTVHFYFDLAARTPAQRAEAVTNMPPAAHEQLEAGIRRWQALTTSERGIIVRHFNQFFNLTPAEKAKTLNTLSEPERVQIEKTLHMFGNLTPAQRTQCMRSFAKFVNMTSTDRAQFLKNAELWQRMTPSERQTWRNLVSNLSHAPPLPPGLSLPPAPQVAAPQGVASPRRPDTLVTNGN